MKSEKIVSTSKMRIRKRWSVLAVVLAVPALIAGVTVAAMVASTDPVENDFTPADPPQVTVEETFTTGDLVKQDAYIALEDNEYTCYVRADVVVTWQDANGNVYGQLPVENAEYTITYGDGWKQIGDFWYYQTPVADKTGDLIETCTVLGVAPADGYTLHVEILAQAVQSVPTTAISELWGITPAQLAD